MARGRRRYYHSKTTDPGNFKHYNRANIGERAQRYADRSTMSVYAYIDYPSVPAGVDPKDYWLITVSEGLASRIGGDDVVEFTKSTKVELLPPGPKKSEDVLNEELGYG